MGKVVLNFFLRPLYTRLQVEPKQNIFLLAFENLIRAAIENTRQYACFAAIVRSSFNDAAWKEGLADIRECEDWVLFVDWVHRHNTSMTCTRHPPTVNWTSSCHASYLPCINRDPAAAPFFISSSASILIDHHRPRPQLKRQ